MTLPASRIGDKGQRWQVEALGYPREGEWATIGWSDTRDGARAMASSIKNHPSCTQTRISDRWRGA